MKEKIESLLVGESFKEYLEGVELFNEYVGTQDFPDEVLDQNIIERVCAVLIPESWVSHDDYVKDLEKFMKTLPDYLCYIEDDDIGHYLRGLVLFMNGLSQHQIDTSGFVLSGAGYLSCMSATGVIKRYFEDMKNLEAAELFTSMEAFFDAIVSAQFGVNNALMKIKDWNTSMADGFYNILTAADINTQDKMLGSLYEVVDHDVVKNKIFDQYINKLKELKKRYTDESKEEHVNGINEILEMVAIRAKGE